MNNTTIGLRTEIQTLTVEVDKITNLFRKAAIFLTIALVANLGILASLPLIG